MRFDELTQLERLNEKYDMIVCNLIHQQSEHVKMVPSISQDQMVTVRTPMCWMVIDIFESPHHRPRQCDMKRL